MSILRNKRKYRREFVLCCTRRYKTIHFRGVNGGKGESVVLFVKRFDIKCLLSWNQIVYLPNAFTSFNKHFNLKITQPLKVRQTTYAFDITFFVYNICQAFNALSMNNRGFYIESLQGCICIHVLPTGMSENLIKYRKILSILSTENHFHVEQEMKARNIKFDTQEMTTFSSVVYPMYIKFWECFKLNSIRNTILHENIPFICPISTKVYRCSLWIGEIKQRQYLFVGWNSPAELTVSILDLYVDLTTSLVYFMTYRNYEGLLISFGLTLIY